MYVNFIFNDVSFCIIYSAFAQDIIIRKLFFHQTVYNLNIWSKANLTSVEKGVREHWNKLYIHKSMGHDRMHPWELREMAVIIVEPLSILFERLWWLEEVPEKSKKASIAPIFKKGKKKNPGLIRFVYKPVTASWSV